MPVNASSDKCCAGRTISVLSSFTDLIGRDDGENAYFREQRENPRRDYMNAGECQFRQMLRRTDDLSLIFFYQSAATKLSLLVKLQVARCFALLNCKRGKRITLLMNFNH